MKYRLLLLLLFLGLGAVAVGWVYESDFKPGEETAQLLFPDDIDYFLTNMHYRELNEDGLLAFEFTSPRLDHYPLDDVSRIKTPSMQITTDSDPWQVDARRGELRHQINLLNLRQQVVMLRSGENPMQVYTENINFEPERDLVYTDTDIVIVNREARIQAESAEFDLAAGVYRFKRARTVYRHADS